MNCKVKQCCAALAARKLAEHDPAVVEITRGGKNKSHHVLRKSDMKKVKKQLAPLREELDALRTENEALRQALAEIKPRQPEAAAEPQPQAPGSDT